MHVTYVVITVLAALANGYAATLNVVGAESVKVVADKVQVSRRWMIPFGILLASGALGLLIGLAVPVLGTGAVVTPHGQLFSVMAFTVTNGTITQIDALTDPDRLGRLNLTFPDPTGQAYNKRARPEARAFALSAADDVIDRGA
jgi:hypothetical protein